MIQAAQLLLTLVVASTAAGPSPSAPATARTLAADGRGLTACAVVTRAHAEQALGVSLSAGRAEETARQSNCDYAGKDGLVTVSIQRLTRKADLAAEIAGLKQAFPESTVCEIPGLGSGAFLLSIPGAGAQVHAIGGDAEYVMVSVLGFGEPKAVSPAAESLARSALTRLR